MDYNPESGRFIKFLIRGFFVLVVFGGFCEAYKEYYVEDACAKGTFAVEVSKDGIDSVAILRATRHTSYRYAMECLVEILVSTRRTPLSTRLARRGLSISVMLIEMRSKINIVCQDYMKINDGHGGSGTELYSGCDSPRDITESSSFDSRQGAFSITYHTDRDDLDNKTLSEYFGFQFTVTAFVLPEDHSFVENETSDQYFRCDNGRFVWAGLTCDGHNNCGDLSDESENSLARCKAPTKSYLIYAVAGAVLVGSFLVAAFVVLAFRKKKRRRRLRRTLLRTRREMISPNIQHSQIS